MKDDWHNCDALFQVVSMSWWVFSAVMIFLCIDGSLKDKNAVIILKNMFMFHAIYE